MAAGGNRRLCKHEVTCLREQASCSGFGPLLQQDVVEAGQLQYGRGIRSGAGERLDQAVEFEQQAALTIVTDRALHPEERGQPRAASDWRHAMQAAGGVHDQVASRQLYLMLAIR